MQCRQLFSSHSPITIHQMRALRNKHSVQILSACQRMYCSTDKLEKKQRQGINLKPQMISCWCKSIKHNHPQIHRDHCHHQHDDLHHDHVQDDDDDDHGEHHLLDHHEERPHALSLDISRRGTQGSAHGGRTASSSYFYQKSTNISSQILSIISTS